jgi:hypothetical protein
MTDLYRQLKQDRQAEMLELKELVGQLCAQASRSSSKSSPFTPLKAPPGHKQRVTPVGILKRPPTPGPPDLLIFFSPSREKMEIKGTGHLADSKWAPRKVHPERIAQVLVVSPVQSPKRQMTNIEREGTPEAPKRQEPEVKREGDRQAPTRQESSTEREGDPQAPLGQESGVEREGDRQAPMRQKAGAEREGSKGVGAMVDGQTQTQRLGRSRSRRRRYNSSSTPFNQAGPISTRTPPAPRTYAAVAAQVTGTTCARVPTPASWPNHVPLGPKNL